jgi:hypothetical protein
MYETKKRTKNKRLQRAFSVLDLLSDPHDGT